MSDALLISSPVGPRRVEDGEGPFLIGRDPLCPLAIDDTRVSREHIVVEFVGGRWLLRDLASRNGTFLDGGRIGQWEIRRTCTIRLGNAVDGPELTFRLESLAGMPDTVRGPDQLPPMPEPVPPPMTISPPTVRPMPMPSQFGVGRMPSAVHRPSELIRIGRAPDNDIVLSDLLVSRRHAELHRTPGGFLVVDLATHNGTFVNGRRVSHAPLQSGDLLSIGHHQLIFDGTMLREYLDNGQVSLQARDLTVTIDGRTLLDGISFDLPECSLLAVAGPSGAGKSTLLRALTGIRPANQGQVGYDGRDLYAEYADLRHRIGLVPQDDILHQQLTVRRALRYAAALRFAPDVSAADRNARVDTVIEQLGLTPHADQRIDTLSGGQRKRTSVALELLTEPSLLFLDEPTSGLDPARARDLIQRLRDLARSGHTVVVVTHSTDDLRLCDQVLMVGGGGRLGYYGPPEEMLGFFGAAEYADVFDLVHTDGAAWADRFAERQPPSGAPVEVTRQDTDAPPARQGFWRQLSIVARRTLAVTLADRLYALLLLGLPVALAVLLHIVPGSDGLGIPDNPARRSAEAAQLLVILIVGAVFMGLAGGIRELVKERAVYRRERAVGLSPGAYLGAKLAVFTVINTVQAAIFVLLGLLGAPGPADAIVLGNPVLELIVVIALVTVVSTALGLLISAYVSTVEQTMPVLVGLVMAELVLSGGLFAVVGRPVIEQLSWLSPSRWGYAAAAGIVDLQAIQLNPRADTMWDHRWSSWTFAIAVLVGQTVVFAALTRWALRRFEPGR